MKDSREWARAVAEQGLRDFLDQFTDDEQEHVIQYALDHVVPKLKAKRALATPEEAAQPAPSLRDALLKCKTCDLPTELRDLVNAALRAAAQPVQAVAWDAEAFRWALKKIRAQGVCNDEQAMLERFSAMSSQKGA
jgi:hypothetical protein